MYVSYDDGAAWQPFQLNLPAVPIMDLKMYRRNVIVATEGRGFWILDQLPIVEQIKPGSDPGTAFLFKPTDGYRGGAAQPTFWYWLRDEPTSPVTVQIMDSAGAVIYNQTGQPGTGTAPQKPLAYAVTAAPEPGGGRGGGRGAGGGAPAVDPTGGGGGRGRGGFGGGGGPAVSAHKGLNSATWNPQLPSPFSVPPRIVMWGGGAGPMRAATGVYTVKVSMGNWSQTQTFRLKSDPRLTPPVTDAESQAQLKMAQEVGGWAKQLYDRLAQIRDAKSQADAIAQKTPALAGAAKTFKDNAEKVEGDMTQLRGEANQDALNFPGRMDNQVVVLYGNVTGGERKLPSSVTERYADLKPQFEDLMKRAAAVTTTEVATFNAAATRAGAAGITIK
jgi:hypothetical protein